MLVLDNVKIKPNLFIFYNDLSKSGYVVFFQFENSLGLAVETAISIDINNPPTSTYIGIFEFATPTNSTGTDPYISVRIYNKTNKNYEWFTNGRQSLVLPVVSAWECVFSATVLVQSLNSAFEYKIEFINNTGVTLNTEYASRASVALINVR